MRTIALLAAFSAMLFAAPFAAPAQAEDNVMTALDFGVLRQVVADEGYTLTDEGVDEDGDYYLELETGAGLSFYLYGAACSDDDPATGCLALNIVATFLLNDRTKPYDVMDTISYAFPKVYRAGDDLRISRYVIFDGGITQANMVANLKVFLEIAGDIWEKLDNDNMLKG